MSRSNFRICFFKCWILSHPMDHSAVFLMRCPHCLPRMDQVQTTVPYFKPQIHSISILRFLPCLSPFYLFIFQSKLQLAALSSGITNHLLLSFAVTRSLHSFKYCPNYSSNCYFSVLYFIMIYMLREVYSFYSTPSLPWSLSPNHLRPSGHYLRTCGFGGIALCSDCSPFIYDVWIL